MNQTKKLNIALIEASNSEKVLIIQDKEIDMRREMMIVDTENKWITNKLFTKVLDKLIDKKENSQDVFIRLKSQLELQRNILHEDLYEKCLKNIRDEFINSESL